MNRPRIIWLIVFIVLAFNLGLCILSIDPQFPSWPNGFRLLFLVLPAFFIACFLLLKDLRTPILSAVFCIQLCEIVVLAIFASELELTWDDKFCFVGSRDNRFKGRRIAAHILKFAEISSALWSLILTATMFSWMCKDGRDFQHKAKDIASFVAGWIFPAVFVLVFLCLPRNIVACKQELWMDIMRLVSIVFMIVVALWITFRRRNFYHLMPSTEIKQIRMFIIISIFCDIWPLITGLFTFLKFSHLHRHSLDPLIGADMRKHGFLWWIFATRWIVGGTKGFAMALTYRVYNPEIFSRFKDAVSRRPVPSSVDDSSLTIEEYPLVNG